MHSVQEESQELLCILLAVATELSGDPAYLLFQLARSNGSTSAESRTFQECVIRVRQRPISQGSLRSVVVQEVLRERRRREDALQYRVHETCVADVVQASGTVAVSFAGWYLRY